MRTACPQILYHPAPRHSANGGSCSGSVEVGERCMRTFRATFRDTPPARRPRGRGSFDRRVQEQPAKKIAHPVLNFGSRPHPHRNSEPRRAPLLHQPAKNKSKTGSPPFKTGWARGRGSHRGLGTTRGGGARKVKRGDDIFRPPGSLPAWHNVSAPSAAQRLGGTPRVQRLQRNHV